MIKRLDHSNEEIADQIFTTFQNAYKVEAQLIGIVDFPPLSRSIKNIQSSITQFYGYSIGGSLAGVVEVAMVDKLLDINSLTVNPAYFRRGIASKLLSFVLDSFEFIEAVVETATENKPAIKLYEKHGFSEFKRLIPSHGISKVAMSLKHSLPISN